MNTIKKDDVSMQISMGVALIVTLFIFLRLKHIFVQVIDTIIYSIPVSSLCVLMFLAAIVFLIVGVILMYVVGITKHTMSHKNSLLNTVAWGVFSGYFIGGIVGFMYHSTGFIRSLLHVYAQLWIVSIWILSTFLLFGIARYFGKRDQS